MRHDHSPGLAADHRALFHHLLLEHDRTDDVEDLQQTPLPELVHLHRVDHGEHAGARGLFQVITTPLRPYHPRT